MRNKMAVVCSAPLLAGVPISANAQEVPLSSSPYQYVLDFGVGVQYQPKYPGSKDYILVPFPLIAVQRFFLPGFGQPEEFKAWSQNLGHEHVLTTFTSYGAVAGHRQAQIFDRLRARQDSTAPTDTNELDAETVAKVMALLTGGTA